MERRLAPYLMLIVGGCSSGALTPGDSLKCLSTDPPRTQPCEVENGSGIAVSGCVDGKWAEYGACIPFDCDQGYLSNGTQCVASSCVGDSGRPCSVANGTGSQTRTCTEDVWSEWGECKATSCSADYVPSGGLCVPAGANCPGDYRQPCTIENGTGTQTRTCSASGWTDWEDCIVTGCAEHYEIQGNACVASATTCTGASVQSCAISQGAGTQSRICTDGAWGDWGACTLVSCDPGLAPVANECVAVYVAPFASSNDGHTPDLTLDGDESNPSRWSAFGEQWLRYDLSRPVTVNGALIRFYGGTNGANGPLPLQIQSSADGNTWTDLFSGQSSGDESNFEPFAFNASVTTSYLRIFGHGNTTNSWNSLIEVKFMNGTMPVVAHGTVVVVECLSDLHCDDKVAATIDSCSASRQCVHQGQTVTCGPDDGQCPTSCSHAADPDCPEEVSCGPSDGQCPASCSHAQDADCSDEDPTSGDYYVAPGGSDSNDGSLAHPFATIVKAHAVAAPGDLIYIRGGTYPAAASASNGFTLSGRNGTASARIRIWNYPGETPVFNCGNMNASTARKCMVFSGSYFHLRGFEITGLKQCSGCYTHGFEARESFHNIFERFVVHHNQALGMVLVYGSSDNLILNCDAYANVDPYTADPYENADGFRASVNEKGTINTWRGCRSWNNADDGWDLWQSEGVAVIENSWAFWNGFAEGTWTELGNGGGFKLGRTTLAADAAPQRYLRNLVAYKNKYRGINQNDLQARASLTNSTIYDNGATGIALNNGSFNHLVTNNISFGNDGGDTNIVSQATLTTNSWTATAADFVSVDPTGITGPRDANGNLPVLDFLKLKSTSPLVDAGTPAEGLPYLGPKPDLGAFECR